MNHPSSFIKILSSFVGRFKEPNKNLKPNLQTADHQNPQTKSNYLYLCNNRDFLYSLIPSSDSYFIDNLKFLQDSDQWKDCFSSVLDYCFEYLASHLENDVKRHMIYFSIFMNCSRNKINIWKDICSYGRLYQMTPLLDPPLKFTSEDPRIIILLYFACAFAVPLRSFHTVKSDNSTLLNFVFQDYRNFWPFADLMVLSVISNGISRSLFHNTTVFFDIEDINLDADINRLTHLSLWKTWLFSCKDVTKIIITRGSEVIKKIQRPHDWSADSPRAFYVIDNPFRPSNS